MKSKQIILHSEADTRDLAQMLAASLQPGRIVGLIGELGAGKTTLVRYLVRELGGTPEDVSSPSFTLQNEYSVGAGIVVEHWDLYRLRTAPVEVLEPPGERVIRIIEWPDRIAEVRQALDVEITLVLGDTGERVATIRGEKITL